MQCKVCGTLTEPFAKGVILNRYTVDYFECPHCHFVQTETPYWLEEAYDAAICQTDVGLVFRNCSFSAPVANLLHNIYPPSARFLDYGGGYGLFVRLMRDRGFNFEWTDKYCENLFATGFTADLSQPNDYVLATAFEVFEHFSEPRTEIDRLLSLAPSILFSTELMPPSRPKPGEWWYYALPEGQHIGFYSEATLRYLAKEYSLNLYTNGRSLHLLTPLKLEVGVFEHLCQGQLSHSARPSLLQSDYQEALQRAFGNSSTPSTDNSNRVETTPTKQPVTRQIAIDGVFFQLYQTGIARVWRSLLQEWVGTDFGDSLLILDRGGTSPRFPGLSYRDIPPHDYNRLADDRQMLQAVCDEEGIDLFISTYYTTPLTTPSVLLSHDMIPEVLDWNLAEPMWQQKDNAIRYASAHLAVSHNTARDLHRFYPNIPLESIVVAHNGIGSEFTPVNPFEVRQWRDRYGINKPYFLLVGSNGSYKNPELFFQAFSQLATKSAFDIVCTGTPQLSPQIRDLTAGSTVHCLRLTDRELASAYSGAIALVYPSRYEGFGMPVAEAMACNCPTIVCPTSSLPEVAADAAIYVEPDDISSMVAALCQVQNNLQRQEMCEKGYTQSRQFSWEKMANIVRKTLSNVPLLPFQLQEENYLFLPDWQGNPDLIAMAFYKAFLLLSKNDRPPTTLLVDTSSASDPEEVELWLGGLMMEWFEEGMEASQLELACFNEFQHDRAKIQPHLTGIITPILTDEEVDIKVTSIGSTIISRSPAYN
jgi:glycosyltransferase involved in cell wall biosynthesis